MQTESSYMMQYEWKKWPENILFILNNFSVNLFVEDEVASSNNEWGKEIKGTHLKAGEKKKLLVSRVMGIMW